MPVTNITVDIYRKSRTWKGAETEALVGEYDVWREERWTLPLQGEVDRKEIEKGVVFLFTDVDLTDCFMRVGSKDFEIVASDRFVDRREDFHHIEFVYR